MNTRPLSRATYSLFFLLSWAIVSWGQPAWSYVASVLAATIGYALFFRILIDLPEWKKRFLMGTAWFTAVQLFQLSWTLSHPFLYIVGPYLLYAFLMGAQFGLISALVNPDKITRWPWMLAISASWTLLEWLRTFFLSGFTFNPSGLAMAGNLYLMQASSMIGVYGLSFFVLLINLLFLRAYLHNFRWKPVLHCLIALGLPLLFGSWQVSRHQKAIKESPSIHALLVQTAFPVEEGLCCSSHQERCACVLHQWSRIYQLLGEYADRQADLLALPECVVSFGAYSFVHGYDDAVALIQKAFGEEALKALPSLELPFAALDEEEVKVSNAFFSQTLANLFQCRVVVGLEDAEDIKGQRHYFSSALLFEPLNGEAYCHRRYEKRALVPMGEYIPFQFCRKLAARYGVFGSFTPGEDAVVWGNDDCKFGVSICYDEMFGSLMRENRTKGARMLLNITSDAWFPHSKLIRQHFEHARLRTVENGIPLLRACNTGITGSVDALGRDIAILGKDDAEREDLSGVLYTSVPTYHYATLYSKVGDRLIVGLSLIILLLFFRRES